MVTAKSRQNQQILITTTNRVPGEFGLLVVDRVLPITIVFDPLKPASVGWVLEQLRNIESIHRMGHEAPNFRTAPALRTHKKDLRNIEFRRFISARWRWKR